MSPGASSVDGLSLPMKIASAGLAGCTADLFTFPLDTVKVWLQVRGESQGNTAAPAARPITSSMTSQTSIIKDSKKATATGGVALKKSASRVIKPARVLGEKHGIVSNATKKFPSSMLRMPGPIGKQVANMGKPMQQNRHLTVHPKYAGVASIKRGSALGLSLSNEVVRASMKTTASVEAPATLVGAVVHGVRANGILSLYGGLGAGLQRQVAFCAVRIGLYDTVKEFYQKFISGNPEGKQIPQRILAGSTSAFIAVGLFQPTEVVKIRMQAQTRQPKAQHMYKNSLSAYRQVFRAGGIKELWKGLETNAARLGVVNMCELVTYDIVKETILDLKLLRDTPVCHFTSAFISGFITTLVASPVDVVKTRYMNSGLGQYRGPIHCAKTMLLNEGLRSFYKGFVPSYLRLGSWNIVMFVSFEQYKILSKRLSSAYVTSDPSANPDSTS